MASSPPSLMPSLPLLLLLFCLCSRALSAATITHLPGFSGPLPFHLETGYVRVDEVNDVQLFYYFIESEGNPKEDPILLWLTGGPGCSAFSGLVFEIGTETGHQQLLNLKGYLIGNPATGDKVDKNAVIPYLHGVGIISDELYESIKQNCEGEDYGSSSKPQCAISFDAVDQFLSEIQETHILEPKCADALARPKEIIRFGRFLNDNTELQAPPPISAIWCRSYAYFLSYYWANNNVTREALHIEKGTVREWQRCNYDLPYTVDIPSSIKYHVSLSSRGYRSLVYSGDHDALVPFLGTQAWIRSLNFSIVDDWQSWHVGGQVAGYTRTYANNMTFATVKGAGHTAPEYRPKECLAMLRRWLFHKPL